MGIAFNGQDALVASNGQKITGAAFNGAKVYPPILSSITLVAEVIQFGGETGFRPVPSGFIGSVTPSNVGSRQLTWFTTSTVSNTMSIQMSGSYNGGWNSVAIAGSGFNQTFNRTSLSFGTSGGVSSWHGSSISSFFVDGQTYSLTFT